jgi:protein-L-isoaspartate O-methyltransferase
MPVMPADWQPAARRLAAEVTDPVSRWRAVVESVPRHVFVPHWWEWQHPDGWSARDGHAAVIDWMQAAYNDRTLVTRLGTAHADHARPGDHPDGRPTSSATQPGLVVAMYRHAGITDDSHVLDIGTGSGYGTALLARRLGEGRVTSIDVDDYLVKAAADRLDSIGLHPELAMCDATGELPGTYDRIVSMMSVAPVPASWLAGLRPGGRLVAVLAGTGLLVTADKTEDGGAFGRTEWYRAGFMAARSGPDYAPALLDLHPEARDGEGESVTTGRYPVVNVDSAWELQSMLGVTVPGIEHHYQSGEDGTRTAWLLHPDGSWARATARGDELPVVAQSGPRRLWNLADEIRHAWLTDGKLPVYGAVVTIDPDGSVHLKKGRWTAGIPAR